MKKILSLLLLVFTMLLSACGGPNYEYKDGLMYEDGKAATGTFEFESDGFKTKGSFKDGVANGDFEQYYSDGKLMKKNIFVDGSTEKGQIFYKNGSLLLSYGDEDKSTKAYLDDNNLIFSYVDELGDYTIFDGNGNLLINSKDLADNEEVYNEKNELIFQKKDGKIVNLGFTTKEGGKIIEYLKNEKLALKYNSATRVEEEYYSTGELMRKLDIENNEYKVFYKDGAPLFTYVMIPEAIEKITITSKDGKILLVIKCDQDGNVKFDMYNDEEKEIFLDFDEVKNIKKID